MMLKISLVLLLASTTACQTIAAADSDTAKTKAATGAKLQASIAETLQASIAESAEKYEKLYAARDPHGLASLFTVEAELIDSTGTIFHGREAIEAEYAATFAAEPEGKISIELQSIRPIANGIVVEDGVVTFTPKDAGAVERTRYTATHVKQADGTWLLASVRELEPEQGPPHERLKTMAWLIGDWREEVGGASTTTKWNWSKDHNFLISEFAVKLSHERTLHGTNRLGWDAERKQFRSWIFESSGGAAEGWWTEDEEGGWSLSLAAVDADGIRSSSTLSYQPDGPDAIQVTQRDRVRAGISLPGSTHRIVRLPPAPEAAQTKAK